MLKEYIKSRTIYYVVLLLISLLLILLQIILNLEQKVVGAIIVTAFISITINFILNYYLIERNFKKIRKKLTSIDHSELITYYLKRPNHFESAYLYDMLDVITHNLYQKYKYNIDKQLEYQEYLLLFIHDLKQPIQNLKLFASEEEKVEINEIENALNNLLNFSKISLNTIELNVSKANIELIINKILQSNFNIIIDRGITITRDYANSEVITDVYWLNFILKQLIENAIKYAQQQIKISVNNSNDRLIITIINDGILVKKDELEQIFERGYVGANAAMQATGYGLYYANEVANKLNCQLKFEIINDLNQMEIEFKEE